MYQYRIFYFLGFLFLTSCYYTAFYVMSPHSIEQFKNRIVEGKCLEKNEEDSGLHIFYAMSPHSIEQFKNRIVEGKCLEKNTYIFYAISPYTLEQFKKRMTEGKCLDEMYKDISRWYAVSPHSLEQFKERIIEGKRKLEKGSWIFYVTSPYSIEQFKNRIEVAKNDKTLPELDQKLCNETSVAIIGKILEKPKENDSK